MQHAHPGGSGDLAVMGRAFTVEIVEWTKKIRSVCFEESYPAIKKEIVSCRKTNGIMVIVLSELSQAQENKQRVFSV